MRKKNHTTEEVFTNSTCKHTGHDWRKTTADNYRRCCRTHCQATQRLVDGAWINARPQPAWVDPRIAWDKRRAQPQQQDLFS